MATLRHHRIEHEILNLTLQHADPLGRPFRLAELAVFFRQTLPDIGDRELVDTFKRLRPDYLTLWKWSDGQGRSIEYSSEISDDDEFFYRGDFRARCTPRSDPHLQELTAMMATEEKGRKARFENFERLGLDRIKHDLLNGGWRLVDGTQENQNEAWEWVRMKEAQERPVPAPVNGHLPAICRS